MDLQSADIQARLAQARQQQEAQAAMNQAIVTAIKNGTATDITCDACGSDQFRQQIFIKHLSPLVSPTGQELIVPVPGNFVCVACGIVPEALVADEQPSSEDDGIVSSELPGDGGSAAGSADSGITLVKP